MAKDLTKSDWVATIDCLEDVNTEVYKLPNMDREEAKARLVDKAYKIVDELKESGHDDPSIKVRSYKGYKGTISVEVESDFMGFAILIAVPYVWLPELK